MLKDMLRTLREKRGLSQADVAEYLGIQTGTYSTYETGTRNIGSDKVVKLADFYGVTTDYIYEVEKAGNNEITNLEHIIIKKYNSLDPYGKEVVDSVLEIEFKRCNEPKEEEKIIHLPKSVLKASAGSGNWLDEQQLESVSVLDTPQSRKANLVIEVDGDSMSPMYENGDNVLVNTKAEVAVGDIGIFIVDGSGYIKKLGTDRLISVNPEYDDIFPAEYSDFRCVGKVLGKAEIIE